jgi:two-component system response regulator YesN
VTGGVASPRFEPQVNFRRHIPYDVPFVLVVDDEEFLCREIVEYLRFHGLAANYETDPNEAVAIIDRERPRAILIDINMGSLSGRRVVEIVQNMGFNGGILLMSGDPDAVYRANAEGANVLHVLEKPIPLPALERFVRGVLRQS